MAQEIVIDISTTGTEKAKKDIESVKGSTDDLLDSADDLTGGFLKSFRGLVDGAKKGIGALKTLKGAIAATGIGALVIAVTAAVEWFSNFDAAVKITSKVMDGIAGAVNQLGKALDLLLKGDFLGAADAFTDIGNAALQAAENADKLFETTKALQELQARNIPINAKLRQDLELQKKILEDTTLAENERLKALEEVTRISSIIQQNAIEENKLKAQELELKIANENSDEKRRELQIELARVQAELIDQEGQLNIIRKDAEKVEREIIALTQAKRNEQLKEELRIQQELLKAEKERNAAKQVSSLGVVKSIQTEEQAERKLAGTKMEVAKQDEQTTYAITDIKRAAYSAELAFAQNVLGNLGGAFSKNAKALKAINIAQAGISTFKGAVDAFVAAQIIPPPAGQIIGAANAAAVAALGAANIAKIRATQIPNGETANFPSIPRASIQGGGGIGFNPLTPSVTTPTPIQDVNVVNPQSGVRAYVVESDITNSQSLTKTLNRRSRL